MSTGAYATIATCYVVVFISMSVTLGVASAMGARTHPIDTKDANAKQAESEVYTIIAFSAFFVVSMLVGLERGEPRAHTVLVALIFAVILLALSIDIYQNRIPGYMANVDAMCRTFKHNDGDDTKQRRPEICDAKSDYIYSDNSVAVLIAFLTLALLSIIIIFGFKVLNRY